MEVETGHVKVIANLKKNEDSLVDERYNYAIAQHSEPGSTFKLASLIAGLEDGYFDVDISGIDIYERHLGRLYDNGVDINREMVEQGLAWVYDKYVTDKSFYENQSSAQKNNRGLWQNPESIAPWYWRQRGRAE